MTDASTAVVNIKPQPVDAGAGSAGIGSHKRGAQRTGETSEREGRTFADALKDVRDKSTDESGKSANPEKSAGTEAGRRSSRTSRKNKTTESKAAGTGKNSPKAGTGMSEDADGKILESLTKNLDRLSGNEEEAASPAGRALAAGVEDAADGNDVSHAAAGITAGAAGLVAENEAADAGTVNKKPGSAADAKRSTVTRLTGDASKQNADTEKTAENPGAENGLTSRSGRVEVEDNRDFSRVIESKTDSRAATADQAENGGGSDTGAARSVNVPVAETEIDLSPSGGKVGSVRSAAAELARKLDGQAGNEVVRQVKVVLDRADAGEVRINLRPDNMGRVRVRIRMEDNRLTGRIFVETAAARDAFRNALDGLQTRLVESGFGAADLELAFEDSSGSFADSGDRDKRQAADSGRAAREFENMVTTTVVDEAADTRVNLVV